MRTKLVTMIITVAGYKGGVGKTTTAVHIAALLALGGKTLLVDGDKNKSATRWSAKGHLPFTVSGAAEAVKIRPSFQHLVIDTQARPDTEELQDLAKGCDLMILPATPDMLSLDALGLTLQALAAMKGASFRVLMTMVRPKPNRFADSVREELMSQKIPVFERTISQLIVFQKAALDGVTVRAVKGDRMAAVAWGQYQDVVEEIGA